MCGETAGLRIRKGTSKWRLRKLWQSRQSGRRLSHLITDSGKPVLVTRYVLHVLLRDDHAWTMPMHDHGSSYLTDTPLSPAVFSAGIEQSTFVCQATPTLERIWVEEGGRTLRFVQARHAPSS